MGWEPYRPPWYPGPEVNPWEDDPSTIQSGRRTRYAVWTDSLPPGELMRLIREHRERVEAEEVG